MIKRFKSIFGNEDNKQISINILMTFLIKGLSMIISFLSLPIYLRFFNDDSVLGLWYTILSVLTWFLTFDLGLGNGLRNKLVVAFSKNDIEDAKELVTSTYVSITKLAIVFVVICVPVIFIVNWNKVFKVEETLVTLQALKTTIIIVFITIVSQFILRIINFIFYAHQKSAVNNFLALITSIVQVIIVIFIPSKTNNVNLINLSIIYLISIVLPLLIATVIFFLKSGKEIKPDLKYNNNEKSKEIISLGSKIFINQLFYLLLTGFNAYLITYFLSPSIVVEYQMYYKIFMLTGTIFTLVLVPFWSATTKAMVEKRYNWIRKALKYMVIFSLLFLLSQAFIVLFNQYIFNIWLREDAPNVNYLYSIIFALFGTSFFCQNIVSTFAMGMNKTRLQAIIYVISFVLKMVILIIFVRKFNSWIFFVLIDFIIFTIYSIVEYIDINRFIKKIAARELSDEENILSGTL